MKIKKIAVHSLLKNSQDNYVELIETKSLLNIEEDSVKLIETLLNSYRADRIYYATFNEAEDRYFPKKYREYINSKRDADNFLEFSSKTMSNLVPIIRAKFLATGGYFIFTEYELNLSTFTAVFLIRDKEGIILKNVGEEFQIENIEYLDTANLAMACRINEKTLMEGESNYLSFTQQKQKTLSDYFTDWISVLTLESNTEYTKTLYKILGKIEAPVNQKTGLKFSTDEVRSMVFELAKNNPQKTINLRAISLSIYGDESTISNYVLDNDLHLDAEFSFDKRELRKFTQLYINRDGIKLKFSRGDAQVKVRPSVDNPAIVIIESLDFANALRSELDEND